MNNVTLVGRLVRDPEVKELNDGTCRTFITIAISRDYRNSEGKRLLPSRRCSRY